jgi:ribosomal-protein-alanine N-acetyltransferase
VNESTPPFIIEKATWRDLKLLQRLERVCFDVDAWPMIELLGVLTFPDIIRLKAVINGEMAGFIAGDPRRENQPGKSRTAEGWILTLGVLPVYRRLGIADALLSECEARMKMPVVKLTVRRSNQAAIRLYEKKNYHQIDIWSKYYHNGEDGLVFEKRLEIADGLG